MKNVIFEADFSQTKGATTTTCDQCGKKLGESWPIGKDTMMASLNMGKDENGYDKMKIHHFCSEACLRGHLNARADKASATAKS